MKLDKISTDQYEFLKECWIIEDEEWVREFKGIPSIIVYNTENSTLKIDGYYTKRTNERILNSMKSLIEKKTSPQTWKFNLNLNDLAPFIDTVNDLPLIESVKWSCMEMNLKRPVELSIECKDEVMKIKVKGSLATKCDGIWCYLKDQYLDKLKVTKKPILKILKCDLEKDLLV